MTAGSNSAYRIEVIENLLPSNRPNFDLTINAGKKIAVLKKEIGLSNSVKIISLMLANFCNNFNVSKNMKPDQIADFAISLIEANSYGSADNPSLTIEDFALFFELAKQGKYGRPFDYIDAPLITEWLHLFKVDRYNYLLQIHEELKHPKNTPPRTEEERKQAKFFDQFAERIKAKAIEAKNEMQENSEAEKERMKKISENKAREFWGKDYDTFKRQYDAEQKGSTKPPRAKKNKEL